jgi:quercetin dioxygenase-like cupin family protein
MRKTISTFIVIFIFGSTLSHAATPIVTNNSNSASWYDFNKMPIHQLTDKIGMRFLTSSKFTLIQWTLKKGAKLPPHSHLNEQVIRIDDGKLKVDSAGKTYILSVGQIMIFPSYVEHGFTALTDTVMYEQQTPIRKDFLEPNFIQKISSYLAKNQ